jgi:hypothetical protein
VPGETQTPALKLPAPFDVHSKIFASRAALFFSQRTTKFV